jgi:hypothetical protein
MVNSAPHPYAARDLLARGYRHVRRYSCGLLDREAAGLPREGAFAEAVD